MIHEWVPLNELAHMGKTDGLSTAYMAKCEALRRVYIHKIRGQMRNVMASVGVVDERGQDVTPAALYDAQQARIADATLNQPVHNDAVHNNHK